VVIQEHPFGRTGHNSTRTIFGAAALKAATPEQAERALELVLRYGINHIDVAASYGDAELRIAPWFPEHRSRFFLATKTMERKRDTAKREIHKSLERLGVDRVDLIQLHSLGDPIQWDTALSPGGAIEACIEAREEGLVRFIGVTGHGTQVPAMHLRSLERFDFDSVLLPYSYIMMQDPHYAASFDALSVVCRDRNVAMQTIKAVARRPWWGKERTHNTWYEPLDDQRDIDASVHYVFARPGIFLNTVGDLDILPKVLDAASRFAGPPDEATLRDIVLGREMLPLFV
jgi:aryl-alcohol dehydrogenase-like predicted oxidoreductase